MLMIGNIASICTILVIIIHIILKLCIHRAYNENNNESIRVANRTVEDIDKTEVRDNCLIINNDKYTCIFEIKSNNYIRNIKVYSLFTNGTRQNHWDTTLYGENRKHKEIINLKPNEIAYIADHLPNGPAEELIIEIKRYDFCIVEHHILHGGYNKVNNINTKYKNTLKHYIYYLVK